MSSGDARPENLDRRQSLALGRSEHDGRLAAVREDGVGPVMRAIMALPIALTIIVSLPGVASADPPSNDRFANRASVSPSSDPYARFVAEAAKRFAIPERWIRAVMHVESRNNPAAVSPKGAMGLMQIMPATWHELRTRYRLGKDAFDPRDNILAGAVYLAELHDLYGSPGFLAAYNGGPGRYEKHLVTGDPLPFETVDYVAKVAPMIDTEAPSVVQNTARSERSRWVGSPLFVVQRTHPNSSRHEARPLTFGRSEHELAIVDLSALVPASGGLFVGRAAVWEGQR
ncbi:lytic transglycosylase domain-containing protein [Sinorhizobium sp. 7-81]|uniref:lytic transglycosylase domain-containing protein n=1 Tax=Sinorhizobium sp. 8-89 TaxID=3049089 RepID=UPI0024C35E58|nr:lytic transglycosylase domain-containing protein [Sinorhizobium sp. 8-89]MDK1492901.1 lytic transglycosylase domain-containing protein [Sinorhizobium sp. 8-89]